MRPQYIFLVFLGIAAIIFGNYIGAHFLNDSETQNKTETAILAVQPKKLQLGARSKETNCKANGPLPDSACTPGNVFPNMTPQEICVSGYTQTVRNVTASLKKKVYAEYGIPYPQPTGLYEVDHLIPLELGGNNDISNLFLEAANPTPGFHEKDLVENFLHEEVCAGRADIISAQEQIASDWLTVWNSLTPEQIHNLKTQWSN